MRRAVFVDRDGTLIEDRGYLDDPRELALCRGVGEGLARIAAAGFALVIVSNQSGVARGFFSEDVVAAVNAELAARLRPFGVALDAVLYCPHLEGGSVARYAIACECRKPKLGMHRRAAAELGLELRGSFLVGDRATDLERAAEVGARAILLGDAPGPSAPFTRARDFTEAAAIVLGG